MLLQRVVHSSATRLLTARLRSPLVAGRLARPLAQTSARWLSSQPAAADAVELEDDVKTVAAETVEETVAERAAVAIEAAAMEAEQQPPTPATPTSGSPSKNAGVHPSSSFRVTMLRALKDKQYEQVLNEYADMVEAGIAPDTLTLNCLIEAKAHMEGTEAARETLKELLSQDATLSPNAQSYAALIRSTETPLEGAADTAAAFSLYEEALGQGFPLHPDMFNALIGVCTAAKDFTAAEGIFVEMRDKGVKPKSATYLRFIYACFRQREADKAYDMLVNMENEWRVPDRKDYARMLNQFKWFEHSEGKMRCVRGLMQDIQMSGGSTQMAGLEPEVISGLFREAQEKRQPEAVVELAQTLTASGMSLDRFQQVGVIFAHMQLSQPVEAFNRLLAFYESGKSLTDRTHEMISEELAKHASAVDESYFLLESRKAQGLPVPLPAVNMIIEACAVMGDLDRAFATWAELEQLGLAADTGSFNALLHTCIRTREVASGRRLLARMAQDSVAFNATTYMHQCSLHLMAREDSLAAKVLDQCKEAGHTPNARMYVSLINSYVRRQDGSKARELLDEMEANGSRVSRGLREKVNNAGS